MTQSIGQVIRKLRKERNFTQEELAEQLNVSSQAVSKWENGTSLPDISQVVPIAKVFGVSTDVLFGTFGTNDEEEVWKIIRQANSHISQPVTKEMVTRQYEDIQEGLKTYPNNTTLLMSGLESALCRAHPENGELYDEENGHALYQDCIRMSNLVISYSKNTNDILRTHMIMVLLHSAYREFDQAKQHAEHFPWRADMTIDRMYAYIEHAKKNYAFELECLKWDFMYCLLSMRNLCYNLGKTYQLLEQDDDAMKVYQKMFKIIDAVYDEGDVVPDLHRDEHGDMYAMMAKLHLKHGEDEKALDCLEKMVDFDITFHHQLKEKAYADTPLLRGVDRIYIRLKPGSRKNMLQNKLWDPSFEPLTSERRFRCLLERAEVMED